MRYQRYRPWTAAAASALLVVAPLASSSAAAASEPVGSQAVVSSDGRYFSNEVAGIFGDAKTMIPGSVATASVWIKNTATTPAALRVSVRELAWTSAEYAENVWLTVDGAGSNPKGATPLAGLADCAVLISAESVPIGGVVRVDLRLRMGDVDGVIAQGAGSTLDLVVAMRDSAGGEFPESACDDVGPVVSAGSDLSGRYDAIASTGASDPGGLLLVGGIAVAAGALLIGARHRRGETDDAATRDRASQR